MKKEETTKYVVGTIFEAYIVDFMNLKTKTKLGPKTNVNLLNFCQMIHNLSSFVPDLGLLQVLLALIFVLIL